VQQTSQIAKEQSGVLRREAARAVALSEAPPEDCGNMRPVVGVRRWTTYDEHGRETLHTGTVRGAPESRWALAVLGLKHFVLKGWGDQACLLGWSKDELYRVPTLWSQIWLTGAALLIGDRRVIAVTVDNIVVRASTGSTLKFRRLGREHLA
jgi:hypothetical protein